MLLDSGADADLHLKNGKGFTPVIQAADIPNLKVPADYSCWRGATYQPIREDRRLRTSRFGHPQRFPKHLSQDDYHTKAYQYLRQSLHVRQKEGSVKNVEVVRPKEWANSEEFENVIRQQRADRQEIHSFLIQPEDPFRQELGCRISVYGFFQCCSDDSFILFRLTDQLKFTDALKI